MLYNDQLPDLRAGGAPAHFEVAQQVTTDVADRLTQEPPLKEYAMLMGGYLTETMVNASWLAVEAADSRRKDWSPQVVPTDEGLKDARNPEGLKLPVEHALMGSPKRSQDITDLIFGREMFLVTRALLEPDSSEDIQHGALEIVSGLMTTYRRIGTLASRAQVTAIADREGGMLDLRSLEPSEVDLLLTMLDYPGHAGSPSQWVTVMGTRMTPVDEASVSSLANKITEGGLGLRTVMGVAGGAELSVGALARKGEPMEHPGVPDIARLRKGVRVRGLSKRDLPEPAVTPPVDLGAGQTAEALVRSALGLPEREAPVLPESPYAQAIRETGNALLNIAAEQRHIPAVAERLHRTHEWLREELGSLDNLVPRLPENFDWTDEQQVKEMRRRFRGVTFIRADGDLVNVSKIDSDRRSFYALASLRPDYVWTTEELASLVTERGTLGSKEQWLRLMMQHVEKPDEEDAVLYGRFIRERLPTRNDYGYAFVGSTRQPDAAGLYIRRPGQGGIRAGSRLRPGLLDEHDIEPDPEQMIFEVLGQEVDLNSFARRFRPFVRYMLTNRRLIYRGDLATFISGSPDRDLRNKYIYTLMTEIRQHPVLGQVFEIEAEVGIKAQKLGFPLEREEVVASEAGI